MNGDENFLIGVLQIVLIACKWTSLGWIKMSSMVGRFLETESIIILISDSSYSERFTLGENFISPSLNFCHIKPF